MSVEMADHLRKEVRVQFASEAVIYWLDTELLSDIGERGDGGLTADGQPEDTMTNISSLPEEVLLHIFSFLPTSSLISVRRTCTQWRDLIMTDIFSSLPPDILLHIFSFLPTRSLVSVRRTSTQWRDLSTRLLAARMQSFFTELAQLRARQ